MLREYRLLGWMLVANAVIYAIAAYLLVRHLSGA